MSHACWITVTIVIEAWPTFEPSITDVEVAVSASTFERLWGQSSTTAQEPVVINSKHFFLDASSCFTSERSNSA